MVLPPLDPRGWVVPAATEDKQVSHWVYSTGLKKASPLRASPLGFHLGKGSVQSLHRFEMGDCINPDYKHPKAAVSVPENQGNLGAR